MHMFTVYDKALEANKLALPVLTFLLVSANQKDEKASQNSHSHK